MEFNIFAPSYNRAGVASVHTYLSEVKYVVCDSQAEAYRKHYPEKNLWIVPDSAQGNVCRVRNFILDQGGPAQLQVDDDLEALGMWDNTKRKIFDEQEAYAFIENGFCMCDEGNFHLWGLNCIANDRGQYQDYTPFSFKRFIGGPFQGHYKNECRFDEKLPLKEDYDMTLQVLHRYRWLLRFNFAFYVNDFHGKTGGCASYRTVEREKQQFDLLQRKWGNEVVGADKQAGRVVKTKTKISIDPIIRAPIIGV